MPIQDEKDPQGIAGDYDTPIFCEREQWIPPVRRRQLIAASGVGEFRMILKEW